MKLFVVFEKSTPDINKFDLSDKFPKHSARLIKVTKIGQPWIDPEMRPLVFYNGMLMREGDDYIIDVDTNCDWKTQDKAQAFFLVMLDRNPLRCWSITIINSFNGNRYDYSPPKQERL